MMEMGMDMLMTRIEEIDRKNKNSTAIARKPPRYILLKTKSIAELI